MFKIENGRLSFYQWDINQRLIIEEPSITEVHFCNRTSDCSLVTEVYEENGKRFANVPNILLQEDWTIRVYAYCVNHTLIEEKFIVHGRSKPADYIYTETEVKRFGALEERMDELEAKVNSAITYPDWSHLKWYVMGDSLTDRNNNHTVKRYYDFVQEKTGIQIVLDGKGGTGYGAGRSNGTNFVERVKNIPDDVDIVTIFGSVNDVRYAGDTYGSDIWNTLSWLALNKPGLRVIVVPPALCKSNSQYDLTKRGTLWKSYCDRLQVCALGCDFRYVSDMFDCPPFNPNSSGHMEKFFTTDSEGIHPNEEGHKALAPYFYNALQQELALKV